MVETVHLIQQIVHGVLEEHNNLDMHLEKVLQEQKDILLVIPLKDTVVPEVDGMVVILLLIKLQHIKISLAQVDLVM